MSEFQSALINPKIKFEKIVRESLLLYIERLKSVE